MVVVDGCLAVPSLPAEEGSDFRRHRLGRRGAAAEDGVVEDLVDAVESEGGVEVDIGLHDLGSVDGEVCRRVVGDDDESGSEEGGEAGVGGQCSEVGGGEALGDYVVGDEEGVDVCAGGEEAGDGGVAGDEEGGGEWEGGGVGRGEEVGPAAVVAAAYQRVEDVSVLLFFIRLRRRRRRWSLWNGDG